MANEIRTGDLCGFDEGRSSKFREGSRVRQTPKEDRRTYRPKRYGNNNKDEGNSPKTLNDKNHQFLLRNLNKETLAHIFGLKIFFLGTRLVYEKEKLFL